MAGKTRYEKSYACTRCGTPTARDKLTVKKSVFTTMGTGAKTVRSRVLDWLCPPCLASDQEWNLDAYVAPEDREEQVSPQQLTIKDA